MRKVLITIICICLAFLAPLFFVHADELDDISHKLSSLKNDLQQKQIGLSEMNRQLSAIRANVSLVEAEIKKKEKEVVDGEKTLFVEKTILNERARSYYKNIKKSHLSLVSFFVAENLSGSLQNFFYQKSLAEEDRNTIIKIVLYIKNLEEKKLQLVSEHARLAVLKKQIDEQSQVLGAEISQTMQKIAALSARQQELIAQKLASLSLPRSAGTTAAGCIDDRSVDPGFSPRFAMFSYGIPDRVGMNQWGAYGRAKSGQDYRAILNAYFNNVRFECRDLPGNSIKVQGYGSVNFTDYLKGIGEMPESWGGDGYEALKAQVVAAASFGYAYTGGGNGEICTSQLCQVYLGSNKGGNWERAVNDIKGKCEGDKVEMMVSNDTNDVISAWYSSTFGGYEWSSGEVWGGGRAWTKHAQDTSASPGSFAELNDRAFDKNSPYFYCDWGVRDDGNKTAWLKPEELADIVNVLLLAKADTGVISHLAQVDRPNPDGVDTWNKEKVKSELRSRGISPYDSVADVSIGADFGLGKTTAVNVSGDAGSRSFDGGEFRNFFNLRAPGKVQIVSKLYNVERR